MKKEVGLWIDHEQAVLVINLDQEEEIKRIFSNVEKQVRYSGAAQDTSEDGRDRRFDNHLNRYYDEVSLFLRDATTVLIMGPGEAKVELQKRLEGHGLRDRIVTVEAADKMTEEQVAASVRQHFQSVANRSS